MIPLRDVIPTRTTPWITIGLISLAVAAFGRLLLFAPDDPRADAFLIRWGLVPADGLWPGALTTLVIHASLVHLATNLLALWIVGRTLEDRLGHIRFLVLFAACGLAAGGAEVWAHPADPMPVIGGNGAIAGLLSGYLVLFPRSRLLVLVPLIVTREVVEISAMVFIALWIAVQLVEDFVHPIGVFAGPAFALHAGGLVAGVAFIWPLRQRARERVEWWSP